MDTTIIRAIADTTAPMNQTRSGQPILLIIGKPTSHLRRWTTGTVVDVYWLILLSSDAPCAKPRVPRNCADEKITVSVGDEVHRRARIKAAERANVGVGGGKASLLVQLVGRGAEFERRKRLQEETLAAIDTFSAGDRLPEQGTGIRLSLTPTCSSTFVSTTASEASKRSTARTILVEMTLLLSPTCCRSSTQATRTEAGASRTRRCRAHRVMAGVSSHDREIMTLAALLGCRRSIRNRRFAPCFPRISEWYG